MNGLPLVSLSAALCLASACSGDDDDDGGDGTTMSNNTTNADGHDDGVDTGDGDGVATGSSDRGDGTDSGDGARWDMVGGCPSQLCPNSGLPEGESCSVTVTCCTYQNLSVGLWGCTCTDGVWVCGSQRCACP